VVKVIKDNWLLPVLLAVLAGAFLLLHSTPSDVESVEALNRLLNDGHPTVMTFYSNL
jgi:hypothetical protein